MSGLDNIILELKKFNQLKEGLIKACGEEDINNGCDSPEEKEEKLNEIIKLSFDASKIGHIGCELVQEKTILLRKLNNK